MILSIQQLARAVATALENEVLPVLETRSWPASRVRSSLGLLQFIIDKAEYEAAAVRQGNALIMTFLDSIRHEDLAAVRAESDVSDPDSKNSGDGVVTAGRIESERLRSLLSDIIRASHERRLEMASPDEDFRPALHILLRDLDALERPVYDEASRFLPM